MYLKSVAKALLSKTEEGQSSRGTRAIRVRSVGVRKQIERTKI